MDISYSLEGAWAQFDNDTAKLELRLMTDDELAEALDAEAQRLRAAGQRFINLHHPILTEIRRRNIACLLGLPKLDMTGAQHLKGYDLVAQALLQAIFDGGCRDTCVGLCACRSELVDALKAAYQAGAAGICIPDTPASPESHARPNAATDEAERPA